MQLLNYLGSHDIKYILWSRNKLCRWKQQGVMHQVISCLSKHGLISASIVLHPLKQLCHILSLMVLQSNTPQAQPYGVRQERLHLANFSDKQQDSNRKLTPCRSSRLISRSCAVLSMIALCRQILQNSAIRLFGTLRACLEVLKEKLMP